MKKYKLIFTDRAKQDAAALKKSDVAAYNRLLKLLAELIAHPRTGTGKPKFENRGMSTRFWVRRITDVHRLTYLINDSEVIVTILTAKRHYGDK